MKNDLTELQALPSLHPDERLAAFYQPILALDTRRIVGYEVLGRRREGSSVRSLGPFFADPRVPAEEQLRVDRLLREKALAKTSAMADPPGLFLNLKPSWIYRHHKETGELHTLRLLNRYGLDPSRICIEITEEEFRGPTAELSEVIDVYRAQGCRIAIDDVGSGFSNFDRIAQLQPNLLKVDIHLMKRSASHSGYLGVLRSFSTLAEQIGASLLVEGVETREDLLRAIQIGARYVQGYLFAPAEPEFRPEDDFSPLIEEALAEHRRRLEAAEGHWRERSRRLVESTKASGIEDKLRAAAAGERSRGEAAGMAAAGGAAADNSGERDPAGLAGLAERADGILAGWLPSLDAECRRVFLCRENGIQLSSNHVRDADGGWRTEKEYRGSDWSWRPYFIPHLLRADRAESQISPKYKDLDSHAWIRTVSIPVGSELVLFLDIVDNEG
ncbi:signal transduction protein [Cohnella xylanilytica]|uniref:EAL domain-containing protein n=1 Tax=Cohnella xylanilytica TaxID=557555 RepID=UPI001B2E29E3|nr:EAL domain-containing protein [Cohnella xylanilytica]GIO14683.1 signal transduction protein [Cohnella xylanilytica]